MKKREWKARAKAAEKNNSRLYENYTQLRKRFDEMHDTEVADSVRAYFAASEDKEGNFNG